MTLLRLQPDEARIWVGKVYADAQTVDALDDSEGFATLDAKLLASLTNCAEGDPRSADSDRAREEKPAKGRRLLLRFHEYFGDIQARRPNVGENGE